MARPDTSIDPRIMDSAREEFRTLGFEQASLKSICQRAGVTTGALYKRYAGKEELFRAVVADTVADLDAVYEERTAVPASALSGFVLLLTGAEGTAYANFQHDWVEKMTEGTWTYYAEARRRGLCTVDMTREELHVVLSAFWTTIYEPFIHDFTWPEIQRHCTLVCRLFDWYAALGFPKG